MGRIKKIATERHIATQSPAVADFVHHASLAPLHHIPKTLSDFPQQWPFPRGDLYHWIPLLNRFDQVLEQFNKEYGLDSGPQTQPFGRRLLLRGVAVEGSSANEVSSQELDKLGFSTEGDRVVVESIVNFERILLEHCGNRSLYASSGHINDLLNTTSLSLLRLSLRLALRLAQRYQVARCKNTNPHTQTMLLANHYAFNLDNLHKLAMPFPKSSLSSGAPAASTAGKGKDKVPQSQTYNASDLVLIAKEPHILAAKADIATVSLTYYDQSMPVSTPRTGTAQQPTEASPSTPTPVRRTSNLGPSRDRPSPGDRSASANDVSPGAVKPREHDTSSSAQKLFQASAAQVIETPAWSLLREAVPQIPAELHYDLLNRVRIAKALTSPDEFSQPLLEIRLLAIANLAYSLSESKFQEKVGIPDSEEPRRYHLAQQLCDLLQPAANGQKTLSLGTETTVLITLEALLKARHKVGEVTEALAIAVNHGVLYYELRKVISTLNVKEHDDKNLELEELDWREATFDLVNSLQLQSTQARGGERMVQAGVIGILAEILGLRTIRAQRFQEKTLQFFTSFVHNIPASLQAFASNRGFDLIADLAEYEVRTALEKATSGKGLPPQFKSKVVDYDIPFFQQATLRQLFKFTAHMFDHSAGNNDRLLRNLIDTPEVLGALRTVIENAKTFGSNVWDGAINIMSTFIHNEPTSYNVVGEAGLPRSMLETITGDKLPDEIPSEFVPTEVDLPSDLQVDQTGEFRFPTTSGILPVGETMCDIPAAFGAICLNETGMQLFQASKALIKYFDIFVSPAHVRALEEEGNMAAAIGSAFDELSRHQPRLKGQIVMSVISMVKRVASLCREMAEIKGSGAKLYPLNRDQAATHPQAYVDTMAESGHAVPYLTACVKFLDGFFHNSSMCALFCDKGGAEHVMNLAVASSNPYDLAAFTAYPKLSGVLRTMCDAKAHLVLPSILHRLQTALVAVKPIVDARKPEGAFASFISSEYPASQEDTAKSITAFKSLAMIHTISDVLGKTLAPPSYTGRSANQSSQLFMTLNFTDIYIQLVDDLSKLHAACLWESLALQKMMPQELKEKSDPKPYIMRRIDSQGYVEFANESRLAEALGVNGKKDGDHRPLVQEDYAIKNAKGLRYVLDQTPKGIETFFHTLGQVLVPKRTSDWSTKQHAALVAEHLAKAYLSELDNQKFGEVDETTELKYLAMLLQGICKVMLKTSFSMDGYGPKESLTIVLNKFYLYDGFSELNKLLVRFGNVISSGLSANKPLDDTDRSARDGLQSILDFYAHVARHKTIVDSFQTQSISMRDHKQPDYFVPGQLVVEIRYAILSAVTKLWDSDAIQAVGEAYVKKIIDILRIVLKAEGEDRAIRRSEHATRRIRTNAATFALNHAHGVRRVSNGSNVAEDLALAREAIYRCNDQVTSAREYAELRRPPICAPRFPIPNGEEPSHDAGSEAHPAAANVRPSSSDRSVEMTDAADNESPIPALLDNGAIGTDPLSDDEEGGPGLRLPSDLGQDDFLPMFGDGRNLQEFRNLGANGSHEANGPPTRSPAEDTHQPFTTVEDLDDRRKELREKLIDRCLEVLSAVPGVTFELADLIQAAVAKSGDGAIPRADIGSTLVSSLMSLQTEEPSKEAGIKISATAHLVALILQDRDFFDSTLDKLKDTFETLVACIQLKSDQKTEDAPWIETILLIIERVLSEDEQPTLIDWVVPSREDPLQQISEPELPALTVSFELRTTLFDALIELLPRVGKNSSLALSVSRVLVTLTRRRELALRLSEKQSMHRLFMMIRQLSGSVDEKLHSCFMLILRHMIEDENMLRQTMQTEIKAAFDSHRGPRQMDTSSYTRNLYYLVLRDPNLFVDVSKDLVEVRYEGHDNRPQSLALKKEKPATSPAKASTDEEEKPGASVRPSVESGSADDAQKLAELKPPTVETTDGVIAFLLRELSNYKDVEDRVPVVHKEAQAGAEPNGEADKSDVDMADVSATPTPTSTPVPSGPGPTEPPKSEKPMFKADEHSIYIYRCFILQCLSELLMSYNRTKVEFINFSRKPEAQTATPSKPRAGMLNYLLNVLIPVGTLEHKDDIAHRKKLQTSNWATTVIVALCARTPERGLKLPRSPSSDQEENPDLMFVRKFVLEHALRSFKEANTLTEPLDQRYARLLAFGELFNRILTKTERNGVTAPASAANSPSPQVGRLMYEKNYIGAFTSAIAELDLNFPNAKRAVKYILGPLRLLTDLGVELSQTSELSSSAPGTSTEEDDISSATSVSDDEEEREQTPDLLRNTTLGIFEAGADQDEDSSDADDGDDDEMYDDGYEDGMDYEEEEMPEHGDVVSDEDDEEGMEGMGEVEGLPGDMDMDIEVVMDHDDEDGEDDEDLDEDSDDDEEEDDDDDDEDDDDFHEHIDEITGDDENASLAEGDENDWEEDDGEGRYDPDHDGGSPHGGALAQALMDDVGPETLPFVDIVDGVEGEEYFEDEILPDDEDGTARQTFYYYNGPTDQSIEEDEEIDYENDVVYEPELEGLWNSFRDINRLMQQLNMIPDDEEDGQEEGGWGGWDAQPPPAIIRPPHHHHHGMQRDIGEMLNMLGGNHIRRTIMSTHHTHDRLLTLTTAPTFRSHRTASNPREDDGTNPLLHREGASASRDRGEALDNTLARLRLPRSDFLQNLVATVDMGAGHNGTINVSFGDMRGLPPMFHFAGRPGRWDDLDPGAPWRDQAGSRIYDLAGSRRSNDNTAEAHAVEFRLMSTVARWQEEARMLFGGKHQEKAMRVIGSICRLLVPPARKARLEQEKAERERKEIEEKAREEQRRKAEAEKAEKEAREKREREEREEREARDREEAARREQQMHEDDAGDGEMEGVEQNRVEAPAEPTPALPEQSEASPERITTTIRGREVDVTALGIDRDFLEAIPEEMREDVIMQQLQDQRAQATQAGEAPTEINRDFLDALPPDIQHELLRQESYERRRREREEARRLAQQDSGGTQPAQPEEMNNADFMAMLEPGLRQAVLMEADEPTIATLPEHLQAEARALVGDRPARRVPIGGIRSVDSRIRIMNDDRTDQAARELSRQRRPVIQMLDKPGVATMLRLMFVSLNSKAKTNLHNILSDVCKNTHNRAEVISILLSILQDGTADVGAVERSFAQLSLRAKHASAPKTPQPLKRTLTGQMPSPTTELSPLNIVQHCLSTLNSLASDNPKVPSFFLTEHETIHTQKAKASTKKGKCRESRAAKYPLNALLALLDRKLITENTGVMETLAALLSRVTHPLTMLQRRAKDGEKQADVQTTTNDVAQSPGPTADISMGEASAGGAVAEASNEPSIFAVEQTSDAATKGSAKPEESKRRRELTPPEVPDENIRLVVNILSARECPSKTFSDTCDIIKNLSAMPGVKEVFGKELVRHAQELGQSVLLDLQGLAKQIESAETGTDLQGLALANFSSAGSKQRKLLRILLALDHLFDPKRTPQGQNASSSADPGLKDDVLALLYDSHTFEQLWSNLTACLAAIRRRGNMVNVATILLPLIESLMVVCQNSTLKEAASTSVAVTSPLETTPPPESRMESLFFRFTEDNRNILNELIRNNPKLMSGNLSILARNSKVLDFDNKRTYFNRKLHNRGEIRVAHPSLQLSVRRDHVFLDSFKSLYYKSPDEIKYGKLNIRFHGEEGIDAGGVSREWFAAMSRQMFNPDYALFRPVASDRTTFHPNENSEVNGEHLMFFKFIGRIIGKALYENRLLDCHFSRAVYRKLLSKSVSLKDMESLDLQDYKALVWMLENSIDGILYHTFAYSYDRFGETQTKDLIPNGRNIDVTDENKQEYVQKVVEFRLIGSVEEQLDKFLEGFHEIIPTELVSMFNEQELELLISGLPDIDVDDWKNNTEYHNYQPTSPQIQWFWRAIKSFDKEEKAKLLQFVTGTSKVPLNGFKELEGMNGFAKFNIHRDYSSKEKLPTSHTCFNQLDLPEYESYEQLRHQLYTAITAGAEYFGFA